MSGILGSDSGPVAETTMSAEREPLLVSMSQQSRSPLQVMRWTSELKRMWGRSRKTSATCSR